VAFSLARPGRRRQQADDSRSPPSIHPSINKLCIIRPANSQSPLQMAGRPSTFHIRNGLGRSKIGDGRLRGGGNVAFSYGSSSFLSAFTWPLTLTGKDGKRSGEMASIKCWQSILFTVHRFSSFTLIIVWSWTLEVFEGVLGTGGIIQTFFKYTFKV
jgi:hypothetical protein